MKEEEGPEGGLRTAFFHVTLESKKIKEELNSLLHAPKSTLHFHKLLPCS